MRQKIRAHPSWSAALAELRTARTILMLGATDTGKTTFLTWLANILHAQGHQVAIIDADVGQSSIGPPTTIGLGVVAQPLQSLQELMPCGLCFVGSTSPRGHLLPMVVGARRLMDRALTLAVDHVIIDTCGFITGQAGRTLQQYTINLLDPDAVVSLQHVDECEGLLRAYRRRQRPRILRLRPSPACRRRGLEERRTFRERTLQCYFANAIPITLPWDDLDLIDTPLWCGVPVDLSRYADLCHPGFPEICWMERDGHDLLVVTQEPLAPSHLAAVERAVGLRVHAWSVVTLQGTLLGLLNYTAEVLGLGLVRQIDFANHRLEIMAACDGNAIVGIQWSRTRMNSHLHLQWEGERADLA